VEIIKVLGTPTKEELKSMNPNYQEFKFPQIRAHPWESMFPGSAPEAVNLVGRLLTYIPNQRFKAIEACSHEFFDQLRDPSCRFNLESTAELVPENSTQSHQQSKPISVEMFEFTDEELSLNPSMKSRLEKWSVAK